MTVVAAVVTDEAKKYWPQFFGGLTGVWSPLITSFKIGRGGWINPGTGKVPRTPDSSLTNLDIILDYSRSSGTRRYISPAPGALAGNIMFLEKSLSLVNFTWEAPRTLKIQCLLDFPDFNDIQGVPSTPPGGGVLVPAGVNPDLYEIGAFSAHPSGSGELMVLYGTFAVETKNIGIQLDNELRMTFA